MHPCDRTLSLVIDDNPFHLIGAFPGPVSRDIVKCDDSSLTVSLTRRTRGDTTKSYVIQERVSISHKLTLSTGYPNPRRLPVPAGQDEVYNVSGSAFHESAADGDRKVYREQTHASTWHSSPCQTPTFPQLV